MKLKYFVLGGLTSTAVGIFICLAIVKTPQLFDALMWRVERLQGSDSYIQRKIEGFLTQIFVAQDQFTPAGSKYLIGDSHLHLIPQHLTPWAVNYAIGGQPMARIVQRIKHLPGLKQASAVLVNGGENDLSHGTSVEEIAQHWQAMFVENPDIKNFICIGLPETFATRRHAEKAASLNKRIEQICRAKGAPFVALRMGSNDFLGYGLADDHVHLSPEAMVPLAALLARNAMARAHSN